MDTTRKTALSLLGALFAMYLGGILVHQLGGVRYPAIPAYDYEYNTLNDIFEAFVVLPVGAVALWLLAKGTAGGWTAAAGVAAFTIYNYAMMVTGMQNNWVFLWTAKLAVAGPLLAICWHKLLPPAVISRRGRVAMAVYVALVALVFSMPMARRLAASAAGKMVDMSMIMRDNVDWANPALRDPIVFFSMVVPLAVAAAVGLARGTVEGARAATVLATFIVGTVSAILVTGPLKEYLLEGSAAPQTLGMSAVMVLAAVPSVIWLAKVVRKER